jgi:hypothetical protein
VFKWWLNIAVNLNRIKNIYFSAKAPNLLSNITTV